MIPAVLNNPIPERFRRISGSVLKVVAVITMLIDHIGAGLVMPLLLHGSNLFFDSRNTAVIFYRVLRGIGRTAFPIYCFLLVEGLLHTKSRPRYLLSLLGFAFLSEAPFDLALIADNEAANTLDIGNVLLSNRERLMQYQNVFFTLAIGFAVIWLSDIIFRYASRFIDGYARKKGAGHGYYALPVYTLAALLSFTAFIAGCLLATLLHTDYSSRGIILIFCFYLLRHVRLLALGTGYYYFANYVYNEVWAFPAFLLALFYNDSRGFIKGRLKYLFYVFYPLHLMGIYFARTMIL